MYKCIVDKSKLRDSKNALKTCSLFLEYQHQTTSDDSPIYNLKEMDWNGTKSMYQIYIACNSEYEAAYKLLGSWQHWQRLCKCKWFEPYISTWREEREIREKAIGRAMLINLAQDGNAMAAKTLADDDNKKRGRPSKQEVAKQTKINAEVEEIISNGFKVINGSKDK